jgi:hypothetical protein
LQPELGSLLYCFDQTLVIVGSKEKI